jgi:curved DNA-binding protein CbpA
MNALKATNILNLSDDDCLDKEKIRKAYLKASLKFHPDKYGDNGDAFKEVNEAYVYLCDNNEMYSGDTKNNFDSILEELITKFSQKTNWNNVFIKTTMKGIFLKCDDYILNIFENLEKDKSIEVFDFLTSIEYLTQIENSYIDKIKKIIHKKMKYDNIIILNPTIKDLMDDQVYKLEIDENIFYIPLWNNELYFDLIDSNSNKIDLIVKMNPDISNNIIIDHDNNIIMKIKKNVADVFKNGKIVLDIGGKEFVINQIKCSSEKQYFYFKQKGILKMNPKNMFDASKRADINIELELI